MMDIDLTQEWMNLEVPPCSVGRGGIPKYTMTLDMLRNPALFASYVMRIEADLNFKDSIIKLQVPGWTALRKNSRFPIGPFIPDEQEPEQLIDCHCITPGCRHLKFFNLTKTEHDKRIDVKGFLKNTEAKNTYYSNLAYGYYNARRNLVSRKNPYDYYYWKYYLRTQKSYYLANITGSMMSGPLVLKDLAVRLYSRRPVEGVTSPSLYFGTYGSSFCWHNEDNNFYSFNALLKGEPKKWFTIPRNETERFENFVSRNVPEDIRGCQNPLRHKYIMIDPTALKDSGITVNETLQREDDIIITFPEAFHQGYNLGSNVAESVNFITPFWTDYGRRARLCSCGGSGGPEIDYYDIIQPWNGGR